MFFLSIFTGPNGNHSFRALGLSQRTFLEAPFSSHLRDLDTYRRKATSSAITSSSSNSNVHSASNGLMNIDCQGYKLNAPPQIQGKSI